MERVDWDANDHLGDILAQQAACFPDKLAFKYYVNECQVESYTYKQLHEHAIERSGQLLKKAKPGDRIVISNPPGPEFIINLYACFYSGIIAVPAFPPANPSYEQRLKKIVADCKPKLILPVQELVSDSNALKKWAVLLHELIRNLLSKLQSWVWRGKEKNQLTTHQNSIAMIQYTSGSTSDPKGIVLSHRNLINNIRLIQKLSATNHDSIVSSWLPPYHDMGLIGGIMAPLYMGCSVSLMSPLFFLTNPIFWLRSMSREKTTATVAPNFSFDYCVSKIPDSKLAELDLSALQYIFNGAEPVLPITLQRFADKFKVCGFNPKAIKPCYGLAEATLLVSGTENNKASQFIGVDRNELRRNRVVIADQSTAQTVQLAGCGIPEQPLKIVDLQSLMPVAEDIIGEIWVTGACVAKEYWQKATLSENLLCARIDREPERYLRTGDLGFLHEGQLYVTGRIKDSIILHGMNYYAHDIELVTLRADPCLQSGFVIAFSTSALGEDEEELVICCGVKNEPPDEFFEKVSISIVNTIISEFQIAPAKILFINKKFLSKTTSGKLRRLPTKLAYQNDELNILFTHVVPKTLESDHILVANQKISLDDFLSMDISEQLNFVQRCIALITKEPLPEPISLITPLNRVGLSSIDQVQFYTLLEHNLEIKLPLESLQTTPAISDLLQWIRNSSKTPEHLLVPENKKNAVPSFSNRFWNRVKEVPVWWYILLQRRNYFKILRPDVYNAGALFRTIINYYPYKHVTPKQRMQFAIEVIKHMEFGKAYMKFSFLRTSLFEAKYYFPYTYHKVSDLILNCPKPSCFLFFHFSGWRQVIFLLIRSVLDNPDCRLSFVADARVPLFSYLRKEFELFYGKKWEAIDPDKRIEFVNTWDGNLALSIKRAMNEQRIMVVFPDTELAYSGMGQPVSVPLLDSEIRISTGIIKIAAHQGMPLIAIAHYYSMNGLHLDIAKPVTLSDEDISASELKNTIQKLLASSLNAIVRRPEQWLLWILRANETKTEITKVSVPVALVKEGDNMLELSICENDFYIRQFQQHNSCAQEGVGLTIHDLATREDMSGIDSDKDDLDDSDEERKKYEVQRSSTPGVS